MSKLPESVFWMARGLEESLKYGIERWAEDTDRRTKWLNDDPDAWHVVAGTMLVGCYSFTEGKLGKRWWRNMNSAAAKRDLDIHWSVRNAFVHTDSIPDRLDSVDETRLAEISEYCNLLSRGKILDDKGNVYPCHMRFSGERLVLNKAAVSLTARLFETAFRSFK